MLQVDVDVDVETDYIRYYLFKSHTPILINNKLKS
jgi:hypothetical protein